MRILNHQRERVKVGTLQGGEGLQMMEGWVELEYSCVGYMCCGVHLSLPLAIKPMNSCRLLRLMECGLFPRLLYVHY